MNNWYIVQTFSGFEHKVAETLKEIIKKKSLISLRFIDLKNQKLNTQILLPLEAMAKLLDINQG